ncbi:MAG TPA: DNRLRE domain-containing protein, partial [Roseiflexaceae bacterium]
FGQVTPAENYTDVRVGYSDAELYIYTAVFDRRLWYTATPSPQNLAAWDAVTLYLDTSAQTPAAPAASSYQVVAQLNGGGSQDSYRAVYGGNGSGWAATSVQFTTLPGWRGNALNDDVDDRGWAMNFHIPFKSLGMSGPPAPGAVWRLAVALHDRDSLAGPPNPDTIWPEAMHADRPDGWGQLAFGLPSYTAPATSSRGTSTIRQGLDGATVADAAVGGGSVCGDGLDFWTQWGVANYAGKGDFNVQNQADVADWPCFSKYYVTFPLSAVPSGKAIISATLTLHQFGNAQPQDAKPSLIQALTVDRDWSEAGLTWNSAPLALENVGQAWANPLLAFPGWPGVPRTWDVSRAVAAAYASAQPLRLALYEADSDYHSGKYFVSSDTGDWNADGRPTLTVTWGDPAGRASH